MGPTMTVPAATDKHIKADEDLQGQVYRTMTEKNIYARAGARTLDR